MKPTHIKRLQNESRELQIRQISSDTFVVESASNNVANHIVTVRFYGDDVIRTRCTCPWAHHRGVACAHVIATLEYLAQKKGRRLSFWLTQEDALRQKHRTFYLAGNDDDGVWITSRAS